MLDAIIAAVITASAKAHVAICDKVDTVMLQTPVKVQSTVDVAVQQPAAPTNGAAIVAHAKQK